MAAFTANTGFQHGGLTRDNPEIAIVPIGAYDTTANAEFGVDPGVTIVEAVLVATVEESTVSLTLALEAYDIATDTWDPLITSSAMTAIGVIYVQANPTSSAISNVSAQRVPTRRMRVVVTHADADDMTYGITIRAR